MAANGGSFGGTAVGELAANDQLAIDIGRGVIALLQVLLARGAIPPARWVDPIARFEVLGAMDATRIEPIDAAEGVVLEIIAGLSASERRVLVALVRGRTTPEIAEDLSLAAKTVRNYISNIIGKLGVTSRTEAVARVTRRR